MGPFTEAWELPAVSLRECTPTTRTSGLWISSTNLTTPLLGAEQQDSSRFAYALALLGAEVTATELIRTVTAFNGQRLELETFNGHVDEAYGHAVQRLGRAARMTHGAFGPRSRCVDAPFWVRRKMRKVQRKGCLKDTVCNQLKHVAFSTPK